MKLSDDDKKLISMVNEQVKLLFERNASDSSIINTLIDFVPDVQCLLANAEDAELKMYLGEYKNFEYFARLLATME